MTSGPRVNLLPREVAVRERQRRARVALALAGVAFLGVLGGLYLLQLNRVGAAEDRLAAAEAERDALQGEVDRLEEFALLEARREDAVESVVAAMSVEASLAAMLQDVAAVMPTDAALNSLSITVHNTEVTRPAFDVAGPVWGSITGGGETLGRHAPGVERFLLQFEKIAAFFNVHVSGSTVDEEGFATFSFETDVGPEIFTQRYENGLPERIR